MAPSLILAMATGLSLCSAVSASFSLNISGPSWDFTTANLNNTTSAACMEAYSAPIACDNTLLELVASMDPSFNPASSDLDATCTSACSDALQSYVSGVQQACKLPQDAAEELTKATKPYEYADVPVDLVGQLFQYTFASDCRKASNGTYCYLSGSSYADTDFACNDTCSASFYEIAHDYPSSRYEFNYFELVSRGDYWNQTFAAGYEHLQECEGQ